MSMTLYAAPMSSASPVLQALEELEVIYETRWVDLQAGEQRAPDFLALNPNGQVPTLVVDGTPMFEALAILQWLGHTWGVDRQLWPPEDAPVRLEALAWTTWAYVSYRPEVIHLLSSESPDAPESLRHSGHAKHAREALQNMLAVLNGRLESRPYLLGETFTLADLAVGCMVNWSTLCGVSVEAHPNVGAWLERFRARPSSTKVFEAE